MKRKVFPTIKHLSRLSLSVGLGAGLLLLILSGLAYADPVVPPAGYPKLTLSMKTVTPTLTGVGGTQLTYMIEVRNTGGYTATDVILTDVMPAYTTYNGDVWASTLPTPTVMSDTLIWQGVEVGFDAAVMLTFSVQVAPTFSGTVRNTAVISCPEIMDLVTLTAETVVSDRPILVIEKESAPAKPGANKPLYYTLVVQNQGQATGPDFPITVMDRIPLSTTARAVGKDGMITGNWVTWTRNVDLEVGASTIFTFSVDVGDVPSGTKVVNDAYQVASADGVHSGEPYTVTIVDPIFHLTKSIWPDPAGSNREMTYTLKLFNSGSLATTIVISDRVPTGVVYQRGGTESDGVVSWLWPSLDTGEVAEFTYTVYISDVMAIPVVNADFDVCSGEGVCGPGEVLTNVVHGANFVTKVTLDPVAKKPGGGGSAGPVTPTLVVRNIGPGNGLDVYATLVFSNMSVPNTKSVIVIPPNKGSLVSGPDCGDACRTYIWTGDIAYRESVTFTVPEGGVSTIGGDEGNLYTVTVVITDGYSNGIVTTPVTGTTKGLVTHKAFLVPSKSAPALMGRGQEMTYTIEVVNTALATDEPPFPFLLDVKPLSTTILHISHGGQVVSLTTGPFVGEFISWTLPALGTGDTSVEPRWFTVQVDDDLVSGTQIVNANYHALWYESEDKVYFANSGLPVTTTVVEVGLIDSYKEVTPVLALPGPDNVLTYTLHVVNSSPLDLQDVRVYDTLPWADATYQRDAIAGAGTIVSDIVSIRWTGDVAAFSEVLITATVQVDPGYQGAVTNTAVISHPQLLEDVVRHAVAYITDLPVLKISKTATPNPVNAGATLLYTLRVTNMGQQATGLVITDTLPGNVTYIADTATGGGQISNGTLRWTLSVLDPGSSQIFQFQVRVGGGHSVVNDTYAVQCAEGVSAFGESVVTKINRAGFDIYLPLVLRNAS
ncbi:MAG: DUF11 domain-containing protein [Anaerolineae bacterium]|nr:DUF11 domain-containing protein [Anaerolineae bacterium]